MFDFRVILPGHTISANKLYKKTNTHVYLSPETKQYRKRVIPIVEDA